MLFDRLSDYYGLAEDDEVEKYLENNTRGIDPATEDRIYKAVIERRSKRFGFPDISFLSKILSEIRPVRTIKYFWRKCTECGVEYDYNLSCCPSCYLRGFMCRFSLLVTDTEEYPGYVVRYNKPVPKIEGEKTCFKCENRQKSYCPYFGNPKYDCRQGESCLCRECCYKQRGAQRTLDQVLAQKKDVRATPLGADE